MRHFHVRSRWFNIALYGTQHFKAKIYTIVLEQKKCMQLLLLFGCFIIFVHLNTNILLLLHHLLNLLELKDNSSEQGVVLHMSMQFRTLQIG